MRILFLYIPLPIFWALFDQQSSRWTLQAVRMNGQLGSITIKPDQIQVANPLLVIAFIPVFQYVIYPFFDKLNIIRTPLKRMTVGGILAALSFGICGLFQLRIENEQPVSLMPDHSHVFFLNQLNCSIKFNMDVNNAESATTLNAFGLKYFENEKLDMLQTNFVRSFEIIGGDSEQCKQGVYELDLTVPPRNNTKAGGGHEKESIEGDTYIYLISEQIYSKSVIIIPTTNILAKPKGGGATIFPVFSLLNYNNYNFAISHTPDKPETILLNTINDKSYGYVKGIEAEVKGSDISIKVNQASANITLGQGTSYVVLATGDCNQEVWLWLWSFSFDC